MSLIRWIAVLALLLAFPADGIAQSDGEKSGTPRTAWGDPDLQGVWEYWTFTPLERPDDLAGKDVLTDEEAAHVGQEGKEAALATDRDGTASGNLGSYGQAVWTDRSRATALNQSSLIIEPPDGKIPPLTAAEKSRGGGPSRIRGAPSEDTRGRGRHGWSRGPWLVGAVHRWVQHGTTLSARWLQQQRPGLPSTRIRRPAR